jgi:DNA-binding LacI/PurR family transcriptional regulator
LYEEIANTIRSDILASRIRAGERLLPENKLAACFDVSPLTMQRALRVLTNENLLSRNRKGTFVSRDALKLLDSKNIGLVMPALGDDLTLVKSPANYLIFSGIQKFCSENSWDIQIISKKGETFSWRNISKFNISGLIIILPHNATYDLISDLKKQSLPFVCINLYSEKINKDVNFVNIDFYNAAIDAVKYFYGKGRKKIGLLSSIYIREDIHQFYIVHGCRDGLKELGLKENIITYKSPLKRLSDRERKEFFKSNLDKIKKMDAAITACPMDASLLYDVLREENIKMPQDLSLVSFFENEETRNAGITSYVPKLQEVGYRSVNLLNEIFEDAGTELKQVKIKPEFVKLRSA